MRSHCRRNEYLPTNGDVGQLSNHLSSPNNMKIKRAKKLFVYSLFFHRKFRTLEANIEWMARMKLWIIYELHGTKSSLEWNYSNSTIIFNVHYFGFPTLLFPCTFFVLASIIAQQRPNHIFMNLVENQEKQKINQTAAPTQPHTNTNIPGVARQKRLCWWWCAVYLLDVSLDFCFYQLNITHLYCENGYRLCAMPLLLLLLPLPLFLRPQKVQPNKNKSQHEMVCAFFSAHCGCMNSVQHFC